MKILKPKIDMIVKCDCGCEFEFDLNDIVREKDTLAEMLGGYKIYSYVVCPMCKKTHIIDFGKRLIR
ncbi:MAG: hypothetical protein ACI4PF_02415 [Christensenellales bacterium]